MPSSSKQHMPAADMVLPPQQLQLPPSFSWQDLPPLSVCYDGPIEDEELQEDMQATLEMLKAACEELGCPLSASEEQQLLEPANIYKLYDRHLQVTKLQMQQSAAAAAAHPLGSAVRELHQQRFDAAAQLVHGYWEEYLEIKRMAEKVVRTQEAIRRDGQKFSQGIAEFIQLNQASWPDDATVSKE